MKTRRILAASTAALLAFGTTAIVASAANGTVKFTAISGGTEATGGTWKVQADGSDATTTTDCVGKEVKIVATPATGYKVSSITVKDGDGANVAVSSAGVVTVPAAAEDTNVALTATVKFAKLAPGAKATLDTDGEWEDFTSVDGGADATVAYKMTEKQLEANEDWTLKVTNKTSELDVGATAIRGKDAYLKNLSSTAAKSLIAEYSGADGKGAAILDFSVGMPADDDWVDVGSTKLPAAVSLRVTGIVGVSKPKHVYHFESGKLVELDGRQIKLTNEAGGTDYGIEFTTKSFSPFIFTENAIKGAVAVDDKENPETSGNVSNAATSNGATSGNPNTGIALAIAPVVLAAGAVAVVALKKKH